eukprot:1630254-Alexandrium_andersonii.AAC.1
MHNPYHRFLHGRRSNLGAPRPRQQFLVRAIPTEKRAKVIVCKGDRVVGPCSCARLRLIGAEPCTGRHSEPEPYCIVSWSRSRSAARSERRGGTSIVFI